MSQVTLHENDDPDHIADRFPTSAEAPATVPNPSRRETALTALGLTALTTASLALRLRGLGISLWLDEGLSVGISSHRLGAIPGLLVQDGSPPLYYMVLHVWMGLFGRSEEAVRALSLVLVLATIPVAFWAASSLFGRRTAWIAAVLAATSSYLTFYAREARMYALLVLVCLVCVTAFVHVFALGHRRWLPGFAVSLALALYTHNWALYLALGLGLAVVVCARARAPRQVLRDAVIGFGGTGLLYAPWLPTLLFQAGHTGAPWSQTPDPGELVGALQSVLGDRRVGFALVLVGLPALVAVGRRWRSGTGLAVAALAVTVATSVVLAWASSQLKPAWAGRYFGLFLAPLLLLVALGLAREGRRGLVALVLIVALWTNPLSLLPGFGPSRISQKSNVRAATKLVNGDLKPGDLVVSIQMEHSPLLRYYLGPGLRYANPAGLLGDPYLADWRDGLARMRAATPAQGLVPLVDELPTGSHLLLACPRVHSEEDDLEWFKLMERNCESWRRALDNDGSMALVDGPVSPSPRRSPGASIFLLVYEKS